LWEDVDWINLSEEGNQWQTALNRVIYLVNPLHFPGRWEISLATERQKCFFLREMCSMKTGNFAY
jgi:hypothetical protein